MNWETKHKLVLLSVLIIFISLVTFYFSYNKLFPVAMCTDGVKNGTEAGVDCGGSCSLRCSFEIKPIKVIWVKPVQTGVDLYDVAGLVSNENRNSSPYFLDYKLSLFNSFGKVVWSQAGQTKVPALSDFPIIVQNIKTKEKIKSANIELKESSSFLTDDKYQKTIIEVLNTSFENGDTPRLYVTIQNKTLIPILRFPVRAVLYDPLQNTLGVGETFVERLDKSETKVLTFTWSSKFSESPSLIRVYPIVDPYSR